MADEVKKKKSEKKWLPFVTKAIIIAIMALLVVIISVGTAFFVATNVKGSGNENTVGKDVMEVEKTAYGQTINFGEYTLNLKERSPRYLVVRIFLELNPNIKEKEVEKINTEISTKRVIIEDRLLSIMMSKSVNDLMADEDFQNLREELAKEINSILGKEYVVNIRFNNWLIQ